MTPIEIYNTIYATHKARILTINLTISEDKASRLANKFAVKNTWSFYNQPNLLYMYTKGVPSDSTKTN